MGGDLWDIMNKGKEKRKTAVKRPRRDVAKAANSDMKEVMVLAKGHGQGSKIMDELMVELSLSKQKTKEEREMLLQRRSVKWVRSAMHTPLRARDDMTQVRVWHPAALPPADPNSSHPRAEELCRYPNALTYTDEEYTACQLHDKRWTRQDTDILFNLVLQYGAVWPVVADRYNTRTSPHRTTIDLKERYHNVAHRVLQHRVRSVQEVPDDVKSYLENPYSRAADDEYLAAMTERWDSAQEVGQQEAALREQLKRLQQQREERDGYDSAGSSASGDEATRHPVVLGRLAEPYPKTTLPPKRSPAMSRFYSITSLSNGLRVNEQVRTVDVFTTTRKVFNEVLALRYELRYYHALQESVRKLQGRVHRVASDAEKLAAEGGPQSLTSVCRQDWLRVQP